MVNRSSLVHLDLFIIENEIWRQSQNQCLGIIHLVSTENVPKKTNIFSPLIRTHTCAYQGVRNICFSENFAYILHE